MPLFFIVGKQIQGQNLFNPFADAKVLEYKFNYYGGNIDGRQNGYQTLFGKVAVKGRFHY